jgi:hypothetical protein
VELSRARRTAAGVVLGLLATAQASACINDFATDRQGRRGDIPVFTGRELATELTRGRDWNAGPEEAKRRLDKALSAPSFENATDFGVSLLCRGHFAPAIGLFLKLEEAFPGRPETAANLGTALELAGHDAVALKWIRIGIRRDPAEHDGTDWLHARILEAKVAAAAARRDPHRSIAGVAFSNALIPPMPRTLPAGNDGRPVRPHELDRAFRYQLSERMQFVRPKDWVVANLLSDWATLNLAGGPIENAESLHDLAVRYGQPQTLLWARRVARIHAIMERATAAPPGPFECPICEPPAPPPPPVPQPPPPPPR